MKNNTVKILLILISIILGVSIFAFMSLKKELSFELDLKQELIQNIKEEKQKAIDSIQKTLHIEIENLNTEINTLSRYSNSLIKKIKSHEINPIYNIDYISAVDILSRSNYKGRKNDTIKGKDDRLSENSN